MAALVGHPGSFCWAPRYALGDAHARREPLLKPPVAGPPAAMEEMIVLILFVEYHRTFRDAASYLMDQEHDMEVVSQAGSVAEGRQRMAEGGIDTAIVDIPLPDEGAEELVRALHEANPPHPGL